MIKALVRRRLNALDITAVVFASVLIDHGQWLLALGIYVGAIITSIVLERRYYPEYSNRD